ncbi:hypothetical protein CVT24_001876 [Panaeolus cyanescens]|uniref:Probable pectate lyase F n=1 Tax=Panaeolus cyanescens TaxID=181874 RepID=A0A409YEN3_9AGAR|nr:hypothetical protein CVT24_001876 [Panaeolus cyanescens]
MFSAKFIILAISAAIVAAEPVQVERRAASNVFPSPPTTSSLSSAIKVGAGQTFNPPKAFTRYERGSGACSGQTEGGEADAVFILESGATLNNVVIGKNQAEGVHCKGPCTLNNVWWEDVCEDAVTIKQTSGTSRINGGGAKGASDKIVQHNGGGKVIISNFYAENFGKLYRSCGNCKTQYKRDVEVLDSWAVKGSNLVGINTNYGDTAIIRRTKVSSVSTVCQKFTGNNSGAEPTKNGSGPDGKSLGRWRCVKMVALADLPVENARVLQGVSWATRAERLNLILLGVGVGMSQASFLVMTLYKLISEKIWKKSDLAGLMFREGICMFILLLVMLVSVALYEEFRGKHTTIDVSELIFVFYILALSLVAPRLTLHIRKVAMKEPMIPAPVTRGSRSEQTRNITTFGSVCLTSFIG